MVDVVAPAHTLKERAATRRSARERALRASSRRRRVVAAPAPRITRLEQATRRAGSVAGVAVGKRRRYVPAGRLTTRRPSMGAAHAASTAQPGRRARVGAPVAQGRVDGAEDHRAGAVGRALAAAVAREGEVVEEAPLRVGAAPRVDGDPVVGEQRAPPRPCGRVDGRDVRGRGVARRVGRGVARRVERGVAGGVERQGIAGASEAASRGASSAASVAASGAASGEASARIQRRIGGGGLIRERVFRGGLVMGASSHT